MITLEMFCKVKRQHWLNNIRYYKHKIWSSKYQVISFGLIKKNQVVCLCYNVACLASSLQTSIGGGALETESGEDSDRQQERGS